MRGLKKPFLDPTWRVSKTRLAGHALKLSGLGFGVLPRRDFVLMVFWGMRKLQLGFSPQKIHVLGKNRLRTVLVVMGGTLEHCTLGPKLLHPEIQGVMLVLLASLTSDSSGTFLKGSPGH